MSVARIAPRGASDRTEQAEPRRRCLATGRSGERAGLVRFVVTPDGAIVPDVDERLPGRGLWVTADRTALEAVLRRKLFAKAARAPVRVPDDLAAGVEASLSRRCRSLLGLSVRAGEAVFGFEKVREWLRAGKGAVLLEASDGAPGECRKLRVLMPGLPAVRVLSSDELGSAVGREKIVHAVIARGKLAERFLREAARLAGFRTESAKPDINLMSPLPAQFT